jgi:hypothetical protein
VAPASRRRRDVCPNTAEEVGTHQGRRAGSTLSLVRRAHGAKRSRTLSARVLREPSYALSTIFCSS